jgi:hypothetical protein
MTVLRTTENMTLLAFDSELGALGIGMGAVGPGFRNAMRATNALLLQDSGISRYFPDHTSLICFQLTFTFSRLTLSGLMINKVAMSIHRNWYGS